MRQANEEDNKAKEVRSKADVDRRRILIHRKQLRDFKVSRVKMLAMPILVLCDSDVCSTQIPVQAERAT